MIRLMMLAGLVLVFCVMAAAHPKPPLSFGPNGTFRMVQFADMHYGETPDGDDLTQQMQVAVLGWERPHLVLLSGDQVSNYAFGTNNTCFADGTKQCWDYM